MISPTPKTQSSERALTRIRALARALDDAIAIPGTDYRIGIDPLLGLFPAVGDYLGAALSTYIIWQAARLGASRPMLLRMTANVLLELAVGAFPVLGDAFDVVWKANARNIELLETELAPGAPSRDTPSKTWRDRVFLWLLLGAPILVAIAIGAISLTIALALLRWLGF